MAVMECCVFELIRVFRQIVYHDELNSFSRYYNKQDNSNCNEGYTPSILESFLFLLIHEITASTDKVMRNTDDSWVFEDKLKHLE